MQPQNSQSMYSRPQRRQSRQHPIHHRPRREQESLGRQVRSGKAPTLYNYGGQVHVSPHCTASGDGGPKVLEVIEPCSLCTNSRTLPASEDLYRTSKGEKYHTKTCHHIQQKLARGTPSTNYVRALITCRCVPEQYQQL